MKNKCEGGWLPNPPFVYSRVNKNGKKPKIKVMTKQEKLQIIGENFGDYMISQISQLKQIKSMLNVQNIKYDFFIKMCYQTKQNEEVFGNFEQPIIEQLFEAGIWDTDALNLGIQIEFNK